MRGNVEDRIVQHGRRVDQADRIGTIVEVRGEEGARSWRPSKGETRAWSFQDQAPRFLW
jgi:hypothetical protein